MEQKESSDLLGIVKEKFPEISRQVYEVFNNGWDNQVLLLDNKIVFRFPRNDYVKSVHQKERHLLHTIKKYVDLAIPEYEFFTDDDSCVGYRAIAGMPMSIALYKGMSKETQQKIQAQLGKFLTQLHSIPVELFASAGYTQESGTSQERTTHFQKDVEEKCKDILSGEELREVKGYIQELQEKTSEYKVMTHGDVQEKNIFVDEALTKISGVIDFSDARIADPALDFDRLRDYGEEFVQGVYEAYQGNNKTEDMLQRAKFYRKRLFIYVLTHAVEHQKDVDKHLKEFRDIFRGGKYRPNCNPKCTNIEKE